MGTLSGSGLIFMVCVGLAFYLVWRRLRRRGRSQWIEAEIYAADVLDQPGPGQRPVPADSGGGAVRSSGPSAAPGPAPAVAASPAGGGLRLRWGRIGLLGFSLLALLASPVLGALALFQGVSPAPALVCLLLALAGLACLRALALRDQKKRRARRAQEEKSREGKVTSVPLSSVPAAPAEASASKTERNWAQVTQPAPTGPLDLNQALERRRNH